jgi:predicted HicB family RNase H-like nuclease
MIKYKGYIGHVLYDNEAKLFHGEVIGLKDVITFQGATAKEIEQAFKDSINDYLSWCKERGEKPEKSFSGNLRIRITPNLHAALAKEAALYGKSLNSLIMEKLQSNRNN